MIVEDETLIALDLCGFLEAEGYQTTGPFSNVKAAIASLEETPTHFAFLDVNLGNEGSSEPIAHSLRDRDIPFAFLTGYSQIESEYFQTFSTAPRIAKPFRQNDIIEALRGL